MNRKTIRPMLAGLFVLALLLGARIAAPGVFNDLQLTIFDGYQRMAPRPYEAAPVIVADIDDETLAAEGQWPWPRDRFAALIDALAGAGAAAIALDFVFSEPDRLSPARFLDHPALAGKIDVRDLPDNDRILAQSIAGAPVVAGYALLPAANDAEPAKKHGLAVIGPEPASGLERFAGALPNLPVIEEAATGNGTFSITAREGGAIRQLPLLLALRGEPRPSLTLEALRIAQGARSIGVRTVPQGGAWDRSSLSIRVGRMMLETPADSRMWLHYTAPAPARTISALDLLAPGGPSEDAASRIAGKIVLVGASATALSDLRPTPLNPFEPGVAIHAQLLEQILLGHGLERPAWFAPAELIAGMAGGLLLVLLTAVLGAAASVSVVLLAIGGAGWGAFTAFWDMGLLVDPSLPIIAALLAFVSVTVTRVFSVESDRRRLQKAFSQYLSPALVGELARNPDQLKLGGEEREMTFLFTDLKGFTKFTESADPEDLVRLLNSYLDAVCGIVMAHGGTVDKIVGDAVHAMFNAPLHQPDHAERAVACAVELDRFCHDFAAARMAEGLAFGATRIGVNSGRAVVGNFGGANRFDYTAHGDAINTAARLEAANDDLGTTLCVSETTAALCEGRAFEPLGVLTLKGKSRSVKVFAPVSETAAPHAAQLAAE